jgi:nucleoside-diphosphate-sugar epimerase
VKETKQDEFIVGPESLILITGATGFLGTSLVACLLERGFRNLRCFVRPSSEAAWLETLSQGRSDGARVEVVKGNLLSRDDCAAATKSVAVIFHLATSRDGKSYPDAFANSVVTTRNLLDACLEHNCLRRFVNTSSLAVYTNTGKREGMLLDETCPVEEHAELRGDAYCFAKVKQDELVIEYGKRLKLPYVIVRPGYVLGPTKPGISGRIGIDTFGIFLHLGGSNTIPFTYVDNCADAIVLAGTKSGVAGEVFNIVDDDLPSSRRFLRLYKENVKQFTSLYVPHIASYLLCFLWERYSRWSEGQLPPVYNRLHWHAYWKKTLYSNTKLKTRLGWCPKVSMTQALSRCFQSFRVGEKNA